jgi:luciferase family oxidoreductase group 1
MATSVWRLSVLDQAPIAQGSTGADALRNSLDLARLADGLGFHRYWVAEHHGTPMLACASPEALIGPIAALTSRLRVGSGGVMLPPYSPLQVAEAYSMLAGLFPGRIDLAVGRAPGTDPTTTFALQRDRRLPAPDDFPEQLAELLAYLDDSLPAEHPFGRLGSLPGRPESPEVWLLGSSPQSGVWAAELGLPYAFADFIAPAGAEIVRRYREAFAPSHRRREPEVIVAVWAVCATTDAEAQRLASSAEMAFALLQRGDLIPVPPVEEAQTFLAREREHPMAGGRQRRRIVGSPRTVRDGIEAVALEYAAEEVMVVTITFDHAARRRSYELIAEVFDLAGAPELHAGAAHRGARR